MTGEQVGRSVISFGAKGQPAAPFQLHLVHGLLVSVSMPRAYVRPASRGLARDCTRPWVLPFSSNNSVMTMTS
jgi:hypothetical protein